MTQIICPTRPLEEFVLDVYWEGFLLDVQQQLLFCYWTSIRISKAELTVHWVDSSKRRNDAKNLTLLNNVETFIK